MNPPSVTVVIPIYRRLRYLRESLSSALAQTFGDFEILVSDDGPSDEIAALVASFQDARIRYRRNARNLGIALNHYAAYQEARGRYLASLHDDDVWEPDFLSQLIPPLDADALISVAFCDHHLIDEHGQFLRELTERTSRTYRRSSLAPGRHQPFLEMAVVHEAIPMAMGAIFRKSILEGAEYPKQIGGCYDHWLAYLMTQKGHAVYYIPQRLTRYRLHTGSGSMTTVVRNLRNTIYVRSRFLKAPELAPWRRSISNSLGVCYGKLALYFCKKKTLHRAWILEKRAFSLMNHPKNFVGLLKNTVARLICPSGT
jgi:glycosyltransferase involved in cell wall biosynthesis